MPTKIPRQPVMIYASTLAKLRALSESMHGVPVTRLVQMGCELVIAKYKRSLIKR